MKRAAILLSLVAFLVVSCEPEERVPQISNVSWTPCQQSKNMLKSNELSDNVDVNFTNNGVQITYYNFAVTCDFTTVNVTHTFVNGVLNITQQGYPNQANCICYTDVSYTISGISQNQVNVIFINGVQVYCHNDNNDDENDFSNVIINCTTFGELPMTPETEALPIAIDNLRIEGNYLKMSICASGCDGSSWIVKLVACPSVAAVYPPLWGLRISFENNEDCTALPCREFSFNIEDLQMSNTNSVQLNIFGHTLLYEY